MGKVYHPAYRMTRSQKRDFELIATGKRPLGGPETIAKLKKAGLITNGPRVEVGHNSFGPVILPTWKLTDAAKTQWNQFVSVQWPGFREPGTLAPKKSKYSQERTCKSKRRFAGKPAGNEKLRPYKCDFCGGWHLTTRAQPMDKPPAVKFPKFRTDPVGPQAQNVFDDLASMRPVDSVAKRVAGKPWRDDPVRE